jgi:heat shock protein HslJ
LERLFSLFFVIVVLLIGCSQSNRISELTDKRWKATEILYKDISTYESIEEEVYLNFDEDGNLSGSTGCNKFNGSYKLERNKITLDAGTMTKMMCYGSAEMDFLEALRQTTEFKIEGQNLYLLKDSKAVMKLTH